MKVLTRGTILTLSYLVSGLLYVSSLVVMWSDEDLNVFMKFIISALGGVGVLLLKIMLDEHIHKAENQESHE